MRIIYPQPHTLISSNVTDPTERDKMFDNYLDTQTEKNIIDVKVVSSNCDRFMLFNLVARSVIIVLTDVGKDEDVLIGEYDLSLGDGLYKNSLIASIPIIANSTLRINIENDGISTKCGYCRVGWSTSSGATKYGVKPGFIDYSIKDTDGFGYTYLSVGAWAKQVDVDILVDYKSTDNVFEDLVAARGSLVGLELNENATDYEALRLLGFFKDWKINLSNLSVNNMRVDFQGVI